MKKTQLQNSDNQLEDQLVDVGAARAYFRKKKRPGIGRLLKVLFLKKLFSQFE